MPEPLKNIYTPAFFNDFAVAVQQVLPKFNQQKFLQQVFNEEWELKELKQRMRHIASVLKIHFPDSYQQQVSCIQNIILQLQKNGTKQSFPYLFFPDFIEQYGLDDLETSLQAMEVITQFISCEFAIRPFLLKYPKEVMKKMLKWSKHPHPHVRRFSSEGCRPRLPWAMGIPQLKKEPSPILPILQNLKNDESLFVRKSVANNLNDIAKDHPNVVIELVKNWQGKSAETDWTIRHACRGLLKKAHAGAYSVFGLDKNIFCTVRNLQLSKKICIGNRQRFSFGLMVKTKKPVTVRLEYAVYYAKPNNKVSRKIFQITEKKFEPGKTYWFTKEQRFEDFTTRKHYAGKHRIAIVVNGEELESKAFMLSPKIITENLK